MDERKYELVLTESELVLVREALDDQITGGLCFDDDAENAVRTIIDLLAKLPRPLKE